MKRNLKKAVPYITCLAVCLISAFMFSMNVFADDFATKANSGVTAIKTGLEVLVGGYGGIQVIWGGWLFAQNFDGEDSAAQSKGVKKMISGAIMAGIAILAALFI